MRLYIPATTADLDAHPAPVAERTAHAVTPALRAALPGEDDESCEFSALLAAADSSLALLGVSDDAAPLRVVLSAEVPVQVAAVGPDSAGAPSAVELTRPVAWHEVVSVHADEPEAAGDVRGALDGDGTAAEHLAERDLLWYDTSEVGAVPRP